METIRALIADVDDLHEEISGWELHGIALQGRRDRLVEALVDAGLKPKRVRSEVVRQAGRRAVMHACGARGGPLR